MKNMKNMFSALTAAAMLVSGIGSLQIILEQQLHRHGIRTVVIPQENQRDLEDIDQQVRKSLNFILAQNMDAVLESALYLRSGTMLPKMVGKLPEEITGKGRKPELRQ